MIGRSKKMRFKTGLESSKTVRGEDGEGEREGDDFRHTNPEMLPAPLHKGILQK